MQKLDKAAKALMEIKPWNLDALHRNLHRITYVPICWHGTHQKPPISELQSQVNIPALNYDMPYALFYDHFSQ